MGAEPLAMVDPELPVHGVEALRVVNATVMPEITSGPTNAPVIMIAKKGAIKIRLAPWFTTLHRVANFPEMLAIGKFPD